MFFRRKFNYRVSKYDLRFRINGIYTRDEWTSIGDVGKYYESKKFTLEQYIEVENNYVDFVEDCLRLLKVNSMKIIGFESRGYGCPYTNRQRLYDKELLLSVVRDCLREKCWCRLIAPEMMITFGYDYYLYIKCPLKSTVIFEIASNHNLFVEENLTW